MNRLMDLVLGWALSSKIELWLSLLSIVVLAVGCFYHAALLQPIFFVVAVALPVTLALLYAMRGWYEAWLGFSATQHYALAAVWVGIGGGLAFLRSWLIGLG